jgi:ribose-phosphate pyrophosphokinase
VKQIKVPTEKQLYIVSGRSNPALAAEIARCLEVELGEPNLAEFANGEIHCRYNESIRGADVFIVQSHTELDGLSLND